MKPPQQRRPGIIRWRRSRMSRRVALLASQVDWLCHTASKVGTRRALNRYDTHRPSGERRATSPSRLGLAVAALRASGGFSTARRSGRTASSGPSLRCPGRSSLDVPRRRRVRVPRNGGLRRARGPERDRVLAGGMFAHRGKVELVSLILVVLARAGPADAARRLRPSGRAVLVVVNAHASGAAKELPAA